MTILGMVYKSILSLYEVRRITKNFVTAYHKNMEQEFFKKSLTQKKIAPLFGGTIFYQ
jgi:hypothetical protein